MTSRDDKDRLLALQKDYIQLKEGKDAFLTMIAEAEIPESVYNSNAIENSTLTLAETERILLEMEVTRDVSLREVFEAKNLARVMEYLCLKNKTFGLNADFILTLHQMFMGNIDDSIAGKFRQKNEYVRIGNYIATPPEHIESRIHSLLNEYSSDSISYFLEKMVKFHFEFELIHPFVDGNGRIGRTILNFQLAQCNLPPITIRNKEKSSYHLGFIDYQNTKATKKMEKIIYLAVLESLHKRLAYLQGKKIISVMEYSKTANKTASAILNQAARQTIPAFRERGVWKIGV
ncbi:MAG: Fic family protein [Patescibacteria group bacterium]